MNSKIYIVRTSGSGYLVKRVRKIKIFWQLCMYRYSYLDNNLMVGCDGVIKWWDHDCRKYGHFDSIEQARDAYEQYKIHPQRETDTGKDEIVEELQ